MELETLGLNPWICRHAFGKVYYTVWEYGCWRLFLDSKKLSIKEVSANWSQGFCRARNDGHSEEGEWKKGRRRRTGFVQQREISKSSSDIASQVTGEGGSSSEPAAKKSKSSSSKNKEPGQTLVKITIEHCTSWQVQYYEYPLPYNLLTYSSV